MTRMVQCIYLKKEAEGMDYPPYPGELGKRIYDNVSKEAFELWKKHQTMLVNENRLNLAERGRASTWRGRWSSSSSATAPTSRRATCRQRDMTHRSRRTRTIRI